MKKAYFYRTKLNEYLDQNRIAIKDFAVTLDFDCSTLAKVLRYELGVSTTLHNKLVLYFSKQPIEDREFVLSRN